MSAESNPDPNFITNANPDPSPDLNPGKTLIMSKKTVKTLFFKSVSDQNLYEISSYIRICIAKADPDPHCICGSGSGLQI